MKDEDLDRVMRGLDDRVSSLERQVFGNELNSKIQQQRKVISTAYFVFIIILAAIRCGRTLK